MISISCVDYIKPIAQFVQAAILSGHEDWVKALSFRPLEAGSECLVLASGSQDGTIRLWNIEPRLKTNATNGALGDDLLDAFEASLGDTTDAEEGGRQISLKRHIINVKSEDSRYAPYLVQRYMKINSFYSPQQYTITFDALLIGHEAGVTSLAWRPFCFRAEDNQTLLSTSTDSSVILWSPSSVINASKDGTTSLWINRQRFGDVGGQRLGGFVGGLWSSEGREVLAWGWNGGWRRWRQKIGASETSIEEWEEIGAVTGHSASVRGLSWGPHGEYLISARYSFNSSMVMKLQRSFTFYSLDQTSRIHGEIPQSDATSSSWHELGRPQVHGYDLIDAQFLTSTRFISIADEKVARVFEATKDFVSLVSSLHVAELRLDQVCCLNTYVHLV